MAQPRVLLLISGGIAAYKSCTLTRLLVQAGFSVRVAMTDAAQRFVTPMTFQVLSGHPVGTDLWGEEDGDPLDHIEWARWADLVVAAPATADLIARAAHGLGDDLVTTLLLAYDGTLLLAPSMNDVMWAHPATQANLALLRERGAFVIEPAEGFLACGTTGRGRMSEPERIFEVICHESGLPSGATAAPDPRWTGRRVVVTAGPTWEPLDPVRYLANRASGTFGHALAAEAVRRGAQVVLISGPTALPAPVGLQQVLRVETAQQMAKAVRQQLAGLGTGVVRQAASGTEEAGTQPVGTSAPSWLFMTAAVADYRPARYEDGKIKKESLGTSWPLELTRTVEILGEVVDPAAHEGLRVVGFALETEDLIARAQEKLRVKGMDYVVANDTSGPDSAFGGGRHRITLLDSGGVIWESQEGEKETLARELLDRLAQAEAQRPSSTDPADPADRAGSGA